MASEFTLLTPKVMVQLRNSTVKFGCCARRASDLRSGQSNAGLLNQTTVSMGNSNSSNEDDMTRVGYRVLGVQANSPAAKGGLVSFFDFIVQANGIPLRSLDSTFIDLIKASEDKPLPLQIYNWKNKSLREVILVPSRNWPGEGMLGVTIRFDSHKDAEEQMLHVLEVETNSPAELAGLVPFKDYLLGTAEKAFTDADVLHQELMDHLDRPVEFYVYNTDTDEVRVVVLMPTEDWGGEGEKGVLGANVAYGYLHVLPAHCCQTIGMSSESEANKSVNSPFGQNYITEPVDVIMHNIQANVHASAHHAGHSAEPHVHHAEQHAEEQHAHTHAHIDAHAQGEHPAGPSAASFIAVEPANG